MKYRNYTILKSDLISDYDFAHDEYDGAEDAGDERIGCANSIQHAKRQIDELEGLDTDNMEAVEVDGVDMNDYPDFVDAFISYAEINGVELTDDEYEEVNEDSSLVYEYVMARLF